MSDPQGNSTRYLRRFAVGQLFTPAVPIHDKTLLAGRVALVNRLIEAISQPGQHAVLFGERGVGKTSLANCLTGFLEGAPTVIVPVRVQCDSADDFNSLWRRVFAGVQKSTNK